MSKTYQILIVEDNEIVASGLQKLLMHEGHSVGVAYSGSDALSYAVEQHPEVILLDIGLPDMDGYEVAQKLRALESPFLFLIAMSGYGQKEDKEKAFKAGFNRHLTKPVGVKEIKDILNG